jgi:hypothetical protein
MTGNSVVDRFRIFRRAIIVGACAITALRRRSGAAIPDCRHRWGAERRIRRSSGTGSSDLIKDGRDEANDALSLMGRIQRLGSTHRKARYASAAARGAARSASSRTIGSMSSTLVAVLREVRLVLRPDGTLWLVIGDSDAGMHMSVVETLSKSRVSITCRRSKG